MENSSREENIRPPDLPLEKPVGFSRSGNLQVRKQRLELDMELQTGSKKEKEYIKAVYCHSAFLIYIESTS